MPIRHLYIYVYLRTPSFHHSPSICICFLQQLLFSLSLQHTGTFWRSDDEKVRPQRETQSLKPHSPSHTPLKHTWRLGPYRCEHYSQTQLNYMHVCTVCKTQDLFVAMFHTHHSRGVTVRFTRSVILGDCYMEACLFYL